jgi:hypothetical protein
MARRPRREGDESLVRFWTNFRGHLVATFDHFQVDEPERGELTEFIAGLGSQIVEAGGD